MTTRDERLYGCVRQATRLDGEALAALGDRAAQDALLERITQAEARSVAMPGARRRPRPVLVAAGAAAVALAVSGLVVPGLLGSGSGPGSLSAVPSLSAPGSGPASPSAVPSRTGTSPAPRGAVFGSAAMSCVEDYSLRNLAARRFAFDGEIVSIGPSAIPDDPTDTYLLVTFRVNHWYRGGAGEWITVAMMSPDANMEAADTYRVGSRLLVTGEDRAGGELLTNPIVWGCGFTRWYGEADAADWASVFR
jgi:hypothetical protein